MRNLSRKIPRNEISRNWFRMRNEISFREIDKKEFCDRLILQGFNLIRLSLELDRRLLNAQEHRKMLASSNLLWIYLLNVFIRWSLLRYLICFSKMQKCHEGVVSPKRQMELWWIYGSSLSYLNFTWTFLEWIWISSKRYIYWSFAISDDKSKPKRGKLHIFKIKFRVLFLSPNIFSL